MTPKTKSIMWTITMALILSLAMAYPCAAGAVTKESAAQCGRSPIHRFDLVAYDGKVTGKVTVNTANASLPSYTLVARGLTPHTKYSFGYITPEEVYPLWSMKSPRVKSGAFVIKGTFPLDDVDDLQSAKFWVMETPPASGNALINGLYLGNWGGWFIAKLACYYSTDGGVTWKESSHTDGITNDHWARVLLRDLGVPYNALVRMHAIVVGGKDRTGSEVFQYSEWSAGRDMSCRVAGYYIEGVTWNPKLTYKGLSDISWETIYGDY